MALKSIGVNGGRADEPSLVRLYMDLTGATESQARNVCMYVCSKAEEELEAAENAGMETARSEQPEHRWVRPETVRWEKLEGAFALRIPSPALET